MNPNELRFGSIVQTVKFKIVVQVKNYLGSTDCFCGNIGNDYDDFYPFYEDIEPIPLTEEWLLKFGFGKFKRDKDTYFEHPTSGLRIYKSANNIKFLPFYYDKMIATLELCFVHQLQNLYFALTGQELEIKS